MTEIPHSEPVAAAPSGDWERFEFGQPEWLLQLGAASRSVPSRRGWGSRRAARTRRQLAREALAAKVAVPSNEEPQEPVERPQEVEVAPIATLATPVVLTVPAAAPLGPVVLTGPVNEPVAVEPEDVVPTLLDRIGAYTAKPSEINLH